MYALSPWACGPWAIGIHISGKSFIHAHVTTITYGRARDLVGQVRQVVLH